MQIKFLAPFEQKFLIQSGQRYKVEFAFARKEKDHILALHPYVLCRDYILDGYMWMKGFEKNKVYGFVCDETLINKERPELLVRSEYQTNYDLLFDFEESLRLSKSTIEKISEDEYYIVGDPWWFKNTVVLSIYTYLLRAVFSNATKDNLEEREFGISYNHLFNLASDLTELGLSEYPTFSKDPLTMHETAGFQSYMNAVKRGYASKYY